MSPKTQEGKQVVRWNATRHGISSPAPVVPGLESTEDWQAHGEGVLESLQPEGHLQTVLAERVALLLWRLHRVTKFETQAIATAQETIEDGIHERDRFISALRRNGLQSTHPVDIRFEAKHYKQVYAALKRFPSHPPGKVLKADDAGAVVFSVYIEAKKATGEDIDVGALDLPGVPEDAAIAELLAMSAAEVRGCVEAFAAHAGLDPDELLEVATHSAGCEARSAAIRKEQVEQEVLHKSRERILPDDATLQKVARYEAHLSRQLYHALGALEVLQARRLLGAGQKT